MLITVYDLTCSETEWVKKLDVVFQTVVRWFQTCLLAHKKNQMNRKLEILGSYGTVNTQQSGQEVLRWLYGTLTFFIA
jgi:hypothetical protein